MQREIEWQLPGGTQDLAAQEVHVWRAALELPPETLERLAATLSADEQERAARFRFERDRRRFIAARGILRTIAGRYLGLPAASLRFRYNPWGKPALNLTNEQGWLSFNLSHSHQMALYAFAREQTLGIDVEYIRPLEESELEQLAAYHFSPYESAMLKSLPGREKLQAFFACWTRKEAYIKARGQGLMIPLSSFDVTLTPEEPAALLASREEPEAPRRWSLLALHPAPTYAAALAIEGSARRLQFWQWHEISP
jgi:4'-phosphopantetheinyl transferase